MRILTAMHFVVRSFAAMVVMVLVFAVPVLLAQAPIAQPTLAPDVQSLVQQIHAAGCSAEEVASATTIAQLRKENDSLKAQILKLDPPKSGATKH